MRMSGLKGRNSFGNLDPSSDAVLDNIERTIPLPNKSSALRDQITNIPCPCCGHSVRAPTFDQIVFHYKISPQSARLLEAVWKGKGLPVSSERIQDHMWADDIDGGPPEARAYRYFQWSLNDLRTKLQGSGIAVVNAGYRSGYRLVMGVAVPE